MPASRALFFIGVVAVNLELAAGFLPTNVVECRHRQGSLHKVQQTLLIASRCHTKYRSTGLLYSVVLLLLQFLAGSTRDLDNLP